MIIFIDDSGDPGFQFHKGSSPIFIIVLVIFDDELEAEKCAVAIKQLRRDLKFSDRFEFKFNKANPKLRKKFLETVIRFKFRTRAIVVRKKEIYSSKLKSEKESFYNYIIKMVLKKHNNTIKDAKLRFDKRGERTLRNELRIYLSRELDNKRNKIFRDLKFVDSKTNVLIQLADMVAGSIGRFYSNTVDKKEYLSILKKGKRIQNIWEFK